MEVRGEVLVGAPGDAIVGASGDVEVGVPGDAVEAHGEVVVGTPGDTTVGASGGVEMRGHTARSSWGRPATSPCRLRLLGRQQRFQCQVAPLRRRGLLGHGRHAGLERPRLILLVAPRGLASQVGRRRLRVPVSEPVAQRSNGARVAVGACCESVVGRVPGVRVGWLSARILGTTRAPSRGAQTVLAPSDASTRFPRAASEACFAVSLASASCHSSSAAVALLARCTASDAAPGARPPSDPPSRPVSES